MAHCPPTPGTQHMLPAPATSGFQLAAPEAQGAGKKSLQELAIKDQEEVGGWGQKAEADCRARAASYPRSQPRVR